MIPLIAMHGLVFRRSISLLSIVYGLFCVLLDWIGAAHALFEINDALLHAILIAYVIEAIVRFGRAVVNGYSKQRLSERLMDAITDWVVMMGAVAILIVAGTMAPNAFTDSLSMVATFIRSSIFFALFALAFIQALVFWMGSEKDARVFIRRLWKIYEAGRAQDLDDMITESDGSSD